MAEPYSSISIVNYNANPPADDGSQTEANRVKWATIKDKLNDPVKSRQDSIDLALVDAFSKVVGGGSTSTTAISYSVLSTDQGKQIIATAAGITITTPDATDVGSPFVFGVLNNSTGDITLDGSGDQTIDDLETIVLPAGTGVLLQTDGTNWFTNGQNFQRPLLAPQGYLTLVAVATEATTPFPSSDQTSKTAVYYRPDKGNLVPIPNGTNFATREFSELTLTLVSNHVASGIYDVFLFDNDGVITIGTGPVWNTVTAGSGARGTGAGTTELDLLKGLLVNKNAVTMRNGSTTYSVAAKCGVYTGSIYIDASAGQVSCHVGYGQARKWGVWNAFNRRKVILRAGDSTTSWTNNGGLYRASNQNTANKVTAFFGLPDETPNATFLQRVTVATTGQTVANAISKNGSVSGADFIGFGTSIFVPSGNAATLTASGNLPPFIGINDFSMLDLGSATTAGFSGGEDDCRLAVDYFG